MRFDVNECIFLADVFGNDAVFGSADFFEDYELRI
jgi:hypothetical protein